MLTKTEKEFLKLLVKKEKEHFAKENKRLFLDMPKKFFKGAHEYKHFLEDILKKLE